MQQRRQDNKLEGEEMTGGRGPENIYYVFNQSSRKVEETEREAKFGDKMAENVQL